MSCTILIIDDSELIRKQIRQTLTEHVPDLRIVEAEDGIAGVKAALENPVDLILCDLEMPGLDGFKVLAMVNSHEGLRDVPVIIITGNSQREDKIRGLGQGASDYITKPFDAAELVARVRVHLKIKQLQDDLRRSNAQLEALSLTDPLTQLPNRRYLEESLARELERARRTGQPLALGILDIDHFKRVNDDYGHQQGDVVLRTVADIIHANIRPYDIGARYGGEEFVLIWAQISSVEAAAQFAERLRVSISNQSFPAPLDAVHITVSIGLVFYPAVGSTSGEDLFKRADDALYRAKQGGRNCVVIAN
ncbi:MAG: diguanylate cyclase response regulator [Deltaproteobacteria bacterium HGW-Deltaproteobacteria-4]|nr:MAG: diguanylate cyclase response regulator [Deltaproteobacteria bacterium HGW-Deltaproteobacteria-4]